MTRLIFLGTKGEIEESSAKHSCHSSLLLEADETRLILDYGELHRYRPEELNASAILITHAHPDHYAWLYQDIKTDVPVYLTRETFEYGRFTPTNAKIISPGEEFEIGYFSNIAYRVIHSTRCPAVGYKIRVADKILVYNPDLVDIIDKERVLQGVDYYIGDGSSIKANLVRRRGDQLFGHTRTTTQMNWCQKYGISHIIFTHLGKETIARENEFQKEHPEITLAYDGMEIAI